VVEGKLRKGDLARLEGGQRLVEAHGVEVGVERGSLSGVGDDDHPLERREGAAQLGHACERVVDRAVVEVTVRREEHLGLDLAEAVEHALHAEVR